MRHMHSLQKGAARIKTKTVATLAILSVVVLGLASVASFSPVFANGNSQSTVYNNISSPAPGNVPSIGYEATSTSEFGGQVDLDGTQRKDPSVTVLMSSWACKSGSWNNKNCITNPSSTFTHPITLNIYNANSDDSVGSLIKSKTQTFTMPYRPTADDGTNCKDANGPTGAWWDGANCYNGKAFKINFDLDGVTLPDDVIIGVAYNTSHYGAVPVGTQTCSATPQGCPYDSLNVGTNPAPSVGTPEPSNKDAYQNSSWTGAYCDNGADGVGTFRLDDGCWEGYLPAFKVEASPGKSGHQSGNHGHDNHGHHKGDKDHHKKYGGYRGFYSFWNR